MGDFIEAGRPELPPRAGTSVSVGGKMVGLLNVEGTLYAVQDACLHEIIDTIHHFVQPRSLLRHS